MCCLASLRSTSPRTLPSGQKNRQLTPSAIGTILSTIGIAVAASGGGDKKATTAPAPVAQDTTINTGSKEEDELWVLPRAERSEGGLSGAGRRDGGVIWVPWEAWSVAVAKLVQPCCRYHASPRYPLAFSFPLRPRH